MAVTEWRLLRAVIVATTLLMAASMTPAQPAGRPPAVVVDPASGIAIAGYDPVAFFVEGVARRGSRDHEVAALGTTWRLANEGNRKAFADHPLAFAPRYGGYDPVAVARGAPQPGDPRVFAVLGTTLYLFARPENRAAFLADPDRGKAAADLRWPEVERELAR
jgi:hypothetical protein